MLKYKQPKVTDRGNKLKDKQVVSKNLLTKTNFLQSQAWAEFQSKISHETIQKNHQDYRFMAIVERGQFSNRLYCPFGPIVDSPASLKEVLLELKQAAEKRKLDFVRIEPTSPNITSKDLLEMRLKPAHRDEQPPHTVVNDVSISPEKIEATLSQTARRYARKCTKSGITYCTSYKPSDIKFFIDMIHDVSKRTGMKPHSDTYFQNLAKLLFPTKDAGLMFAELNGKKIASIIFYKDSQTMSYAHAANLSEYRKYSPAVGLGLYALKEAHNMGCKWFDWFGVAPAKDDGNPRWKSWQGFTKFKLSYGGSRVDRVGTWELPIRPLRYKLYRLLIKISGR